MCCSGSWGGRASREKWVSKEPQCRHGMGKELPQGARVSNACPSVQRMGASKEMLPSSEKVFLCCCKAASPCRAINAAPKGTEHGGLLTRWQHWVHGAFSGVLAAEQAAALCAWPEPAHVLQQTRCGQGAAGLLHASIPSATCSRHSWSTPWSCFGSSMRECNNV